MFKKIYLKFAKFYRIPAQAYSEFVVDYASPLIAAYFLIFTLVSVFGLFHFTLVTDNESLLAVKSSKYSRYAKVIEEEFKLDEDRNYFQVNNF